LFIDDEGKLFEWSNDALALELYSQAEQVKRQVAVALPHHISAVLITAIFILSHNNNAAKYAFIFSEVASNRLPGARISTAVQGTVVAPYHGLSTSILHV
jgi:hypothetical protein